MTQILNALFNIIISVFEFLLQGLVDLIVACVPSGRKGSYQASFMSPNKLLSSKDTGFCFGDKSLNIQDSFMNCVTLGGSGSGKSVGVLLPSIINMLDHSSLAIHDPSGELFTITKDLARYRNYKVLVLNYAEPDNSQFYNPLERVKSISDIKKLSKMLVHTSLGTGGKDPFWNSSAENLISLFIRYVIFYTDKENRNLYNVLCLLNAFSGSPQSVDKMFVQTGDSELLTLYKAFVAYDSKMLMSIVATSRQVLELFGDPDISTITSRDTIDFDSFRKEKTILFINNSVNHMKYYTCISSIFFEQFFSSAMKEIPSKTDLPIFFLLDEASSLYLSMLPIVISNIRKYCGGLLLVFQSKSQILDMYGVAQANNILSNCYSKCYLPGQPLDVCRELQSILGQYETVDEDNVKRVRPLLTMDEIRVLSDAILLCGNLLPVRMKLIPYFEQKGITKQLAQAREYCLKIDTENTCVNDQNHDE